jgi:hypothetical protein
MYLGKDLKSDLNQMLIVIISHKIGYLSEYYVGIDNEIVYLNKTDLKVESIQSSYLYDILDAINFIEVANKEDYNYKLNTDDISVIGHGLSGGVAMNIAFKDNQLLLDAIIEKNGYIDIYENADSISKDFTSLSYISPFSDFLGLTRKSFINEVHEMEIDFLKKH